MNHPRLALPASLFLIQYRPTVTVPHDDLRLRREESKHKQRLAVIVEGCFRSVLEAVRIHPLARSRRRVIRVRQER